MFWSWNEFQVLLFCYISENYLETKSTGQWKQRSSIILKLSHQSSSEETNKFCVYFRYDTGMASYHQIIVDGKRTNEKRWFGKLKYSLQPTNGFIDFQKTVSLKENSNKYLVSFQLYKTRLSAEESSLIWFMKVWPFL